MPTLRDYIVTEQDLQEFGIVPKDYLKDSSVGALLNTAFEQLVTRIFDLNPEIDTEEDIYDRLIEDSDGVAFVAGKNRVPKPATGKTALVILFIVI